MFVSLPRSFAVGGVWLVGLASRQPLLTVVKAPHTHRAVSESRPLHAPSPCPLRKAVPSTARPGRAHFSTRRDWRVRRNMASKASECLKLSESQIKVLEDCFNKVSKHPDGTTLMLVAAECDLSEEDTLKWFKLRNAQWRQQEGLPAELGSVLD